MNFVKSYKKILKIPTPVKQNFKIDAFFHNLKQLFKNDFSDNNIKATFSISKETECIYADETLLSQVLINLIKNAVESLLLIWFVKPIIL